MSVFKRVKEAGKVLIGSNKSETRSSGSSAADDFFPWLQSAAAGGVNYQTALKLSAVYNAVDIISNDIAKIPFGVFEKTDKAKIRLSDHPADFLISSEPNYLMTPFAFKKVLGVSLLLRGNTLYIINRDNAGNAVSFIYVAWDRVNDIREVNGELLYFIRGYKKPFLSFEVLHFKGFSHNGLVGVGAITYGAMQLGLSISVQEFSITNFENKGVRQGVIESEKPINAKGSIIQGWRNAMAEKSADRVVVIDDGMKFKPITITPQELQIIEQSKFNIEDIARWFNSLKN